MNIKKLKGKLGIPLVSSMEAGSTSVDELTSEGVNTEIEYEIYGKLKDIRVIEELSTGSELQEQYELKTTNGRLRVRKVALNNGEPTYILTSKVYDDSKAGIPETNQEVNEFLFHHFAKMADGGMYKRRYFIPAGKQKLNSGELTDLTWQVDVFLDERSVPSGWVKVDLQVEELLVEIPKLPFELDEQMLVPADYKQRSEEMKKKISSIISESSVSKPVSSFESEDLGLLANKLKPVIGMTVEFDNDRLVDPGPCQMTLVDIQDDHIVVARDNGNAVDEFTIKDFDWNDADLYIHKGAVMALVK